MRFDAGVMQDQIVRCLTFSRKAKKAKCTSLNKRNTVVLYACHGQDTCKTLVRSLEHC